MRHVAIIGGGIGGLATGLALQQRGIAAEVYEAAPQLRPVGAGLWVPGNALQILERLGLRQAVESVGRRLQRAEIRTAGGALLQGLDFASLRVAGGGGNVAIHRADLQQILADALAPDTLHLDRRCIRFACQDERVAVDFEDGYQARADLLVGADGIHSVVRQQLFPEVTLRYAGQSCYRGLSRTPLPAALQHTAWEVWGRACRFGFSGLGADLVYWFAPFNAAADGSDPADGLKHRLLEHYKSFPAPIPTIIASADPQQILRTDLYDFPPIDRWYRGPVALLGDAAHAMTPNLGQGAAQAIEDAYALAESLAHEADIDHALTRYQAVRQPRVQGIVKRAWRLGKLAHLKGAPLRALRNLVLRATPDSLTRGAVEELYTPRF